MNDRKSSLPAATHPQDPDRPGDDFREFMNPGGEVITSGPAAGASPREGPLWTQDESINYEAAQDCIVHLMAICSGEIHEEATTGLRRAALVAERSRLATELRHLRVHDHGEIARIRRDYGQRVRWHIARSKDAPKN